MAELLKVFDFEGCPVRTVHGDDGEPWFVARDVAEVLCLDTAAVGRTVEPDERDLHAVQTPSGIQQMVVVNEGGLYAMVFKSRKPEALQALGCPRGVANDPQGWRLRHRCRGGVRSDPRPGADADRDAAEADRSGAAPRRHRAAHRYAAGADDASLGAGVCQPERHPPRQPAGQRLGKHCAAQTRLSGGVIGAVPNDHYGTVGNDPLLVLQQVFAAAGLIADEPLN